MKRFITSISIIVIGGFVLALLVAECREIKQTHDAVIRLEEHAK